MSIASRTPEGQLQLCPICGDVAVTEWSQETGNSVCPRCGAWLRAIKDGLNLRSLGPEDTAKELGDSLGIVELVVELEEELGFAISDDELRRIRTIGDFVRLARARQSLRLRGVVRSTSRILRRLPTAGPDIRARPYRAGRRGAG